MVKGRTTRMVQEAKRLADQGKTVFILAASHTHAHVLRTWITDSRIAVDTVGCGDFDWHTMTLRGCLQTVLSWLTTSPSNYTGTNY
jgi:hypothetical protein